MSILSEETKAGLLQIARASIKAELRQSTTAEEEIFEKFELSDVSGIFVTIKNKGMLRGCIGHIHQESLTIETLKEVAASAAVNDPRFPSVTIDELEEIDIEITILSPFKLIEEKDEIEIGKHGLFIKSGYSQGLLLPQVAPENNFGKTEFLEHTCMKAGLGVNAWKEKETDIYIFSGEVFGEPSDN
ncbi:MAG: AmmeMemoRadiSam system protein A [bacterium]|nr:AmmeMemoRadiSam system protein A [bacterium]